METDSEGQERINRINYEICVLKALRERLCCKEMWVVGANRYRHPDDDLPTDKFTVLTRNREIRNNAKKLSLAPCHLR